MNVKVLYEDNHIIAVVKPAGVLTQVDKSGETSLMDDVKKYLKEKVNKISFFAEGFAKKSDEELLAEIKKATKTRTAELSWEVVRSGERFSLLKIMPKTGRFHQIRIQLENLGHPILGDTKYGFNTHAPTRESEWRDKRSIALCATGISFKTATGEKTVNLEIPLPKEWDDLI